MNANVTEKDFAALSSEQKLWLIFNTLVKREQTHNDRVKICDKKFEKIKTSQRIDKGKITLLIYD